MRSTFPDRLKRAASRGDLTVSDLARWFDRPRATVNTWINGRTPFGPGGRRAEDDLRRLEWAVKNCKGLPIPEKLSWTGRTAHLMEQRNVAIRNCRVPTLRAAG